MSKDGLHWNDVNDGDPVLISGLGEKGVRDPFILRSPDGDKFYIIATDLRIANKKGWSVAQYSGSRSLIIWESDDLVHWSDPRSVEVGIDGAGCVWAPEAIYDKKTGEYMVFWASMVQEENETQAKQRIYCAKTRDFVTFTKPQKYIERDNHVIDTTIIENEGQYYRYSKDETTKRVGIDTSNQLLHSTFTPIESETLSNLQGVEGPLIFKFNGQKKWCLMVDQYSSGKGYLPLITDDLSSGKFTKLSSDEYSLGSNLKRHGTVLNLTNTEYDAIAKKWASTSEGLNEEEKQEPVLNYDFEDSSDTTAIKDTSGNNRNGSLAGSAKVVRDEEKNSNVLYLDGTTDTYAAFPQGFFDGRNTMTISMDVKADTVTGDFFTFTIGKNNTKYLFLRTRDKQIRNALTISSYSAEQEAVATTKDSIKGKWMDLKLVITPTSMAMYRDGELISENDQVTIKMSDLGKNLFAYLGKSFYSGDAFFKGWFDNVKVYNRALSGAEIASEFGKEEDTIGDVKADGYHIIKNEINKDEHTITLDVSRTNSDKKELGETKVTFNMRNGATVEGGNEVSLDLTKDSKIKVQSANGTVKEWKVKAVLCYNNILKGLYADPDIDVFGDTYYIYPTTDGATGWSGTKFHVFSSKDLVDWSDEGVILDVSTDDVKWAVGSAWAPTIEEKNRKYYFYFCAKREDGKSCIGVAVSDSPKGPFKAMDTPLITPEIASEKGISMGQTIDPSVFTDEDGSSYLYFGNGKPAVVQLNDDMTSVKEGTMKNINGLSNFRESLVVVKRNGIYHFTWSCNDTGSENYEVRYGTSDSPYGDVTYQYPVLQKDSEQDILGTGHQSILKIPGKDEYYMVYHRFGTPLDNYGSSVKGYNRETCLDSLTFGEDGKMKAVTPTLAGISKKVLLTKSEVTPTATPTAEPEQSPVVTPTQAPEKSPAITPTEAPKQSPAVTPTVTPSANPVQPGKNAATVAKVTGVKVLSQTTTSIKISWKKSKNVAGYEVFQKKNSNWKKIKVLNGNKNTWTIKKLSSAKSYQFKVRAFAVASGKKVYGKFSGVLKAVTAPKAPSGIKLLKKNGKATLSWKKVGGATSYVVYRYDTKTKRYKRVATMASKKCSYSSSKFKKGVKVRYKVKACKGKVFSKFSLGKTLKI
ncbi:endo-1,4-beta-xylanase D [Lachnospiraceae bacterium KM106-2]|nr:endo-1,4-beta-xylanase D [Lachnospiraceae bacterium KM106-2]